MTILNLVVVCLNMTTKQVLPVPTLMTSTRFSVGAMLKPTFACEEAYIPSNRQKLLP